MFQRERFHVKRGLDPWYVTGYSEGCASFTYSRSNRVVALYFALKVGVSDVPILQGIQAFFGGAGRMYHIRPARPEAAYLRLTRAAELARVVAHFDRYPLAGVKSEHYRVWREMVSIKQRFRKPDVETLDLLASRLSALRHRVSGSV